MTGKAATPKRDLRRRKLLKATLAHVPFDGWTPTAMRSGAEDAGLPAADAVRLFPGGGSEMAAFFVAEGDRWMEKELARLDLDTMRVRDRIATAVRLRLEHDADHRDAVRKALAVQVLPRNGPGGLRALYRTVDIMWRAAGDTATDFNFYTKRLLLAGVHMSTLLFWLNDDSDGFEATWEFLDRRIANVMAIEKVKAGARGRLPGPDRIVRQLVRCRRGFRGPFRPGSSETAS